MGADYFLVNNQRMRIDLPRMVFPEPLQNHCTKEETVHLFELSELAFERRI